MGRGYLKLKVSWNTPVLHMLWTRPLDALRVRITPVQEATASIVGNQILLHLKKRTGQAAYDSPLFVASEMKRSL